MRENGTQGRSVDGCDTDSALGLESFLRPVLIGKDGYRDEVVEDCVVKILEALVRRSAGDRKM